MPNSSMPQAGSMQIQIAEKPSGLPETMKYTNMPTSSSMNSADEIASPCTLT